jgi:hypothetical protein
MLSIAVLLSGITMATLTDSEVSSNVLGMTIAALNIFVTALYQVGAWAAVHPRYCFAGPSLP